MALNWQIGAFIFLAIFPILVFCGCDPPEFFSCPTSGKCISRHDICDGFTDCEDRWDENQDCICGPREFPCATNVVGINVQILDAVYICQYG